MVKGGGRAPPTLTRLGEFFHHDGMYARKWPLPLCVFSAVLTCFTVSHKGPRSKAKASCPRKAPKLSVYGFAYVSVDGS